MTPWPDIRRGWTLEEADFATNVRHLKDVGEVRHSKRLVIVSAVKHLKRLAIVWKVKH
jgi:hypothetical protein